MIDAEYKFGAYVPVIPQIYKDALHDKQNADCKSKSCSRSSNHHHNHDDSVEYQKKINDFNNSYNSNNATTEHNDDNLPRDNCFIGPHWTSLKLISVERYNHDTSIFEFQLPDPQALLNLPITAHLIVKAPANSDTNPTQTSNNCTEGDNKDVIVEHVRPYTAIEECHRGSFKIMVKRYLEWGTPEKTLRQQNRVFLFTKTDHSYKPPGIVSNYIHSLSPGVDSLSFKYCPSICTGKIQFPFPEDVTAITMIAVGAGIAPMIRILQALFKDKNKMGTNTSTSTNNNNHETCHQIRTVRLLYGVRTIADILQRELLDHFHEQYNDRFRVCYCIGSRWHNIHFAAKTKHKAGPKLPDGWDNLPSDRKELGWADGDKVLKRGASDSNDVGHRVFICGLPGVYESLAGSRFEDKVTEGSQLHRLGYRDFQVVKF